MRRLAALVALTMLGGADAARAECGGVLALCAEDMPVERPGAAEEEYQRLDGGDFGGPPAGDGNASIYTLDDGSTVTFGTAAPSAQPWTAFDRKAGDAASFKREDDARTGDINPLNKVCGADGCR